MKILLKIIFFGLATSLLLTNCNKYLDVKPEDKVLDDQIFSSAANIESALNGVYINLAKDALYGNNLTKTTLDVLAQYYNVTSNGYGTQFNSLASYNWANSLSFIESIWTNSYSSVLNLNTIIRKVSGLNTDIISEDEKKIVLGESYALRAFIHFDLLRIFGPVLKTDSTSKSIPYKYADIARIDSLLPANVVVQNILKDVDSALNLLQNDPIIKNGVVKLQSSDGDYLRMRNRRMNYFALKAFLARVYLYIGKNDLANKTAKDVISQSANFFPWSDPTLTEVGIANPDRIFSSEVLFGLDNFNMYNSQNSYFAASAFDSRLLAPLPNILTNIFENDLNDFRFRSQFAIDPTSTKTFKTFFKYADVTSKVASYRNFQPLIRISELYLIIAETENDYTSASNYINLVRFNRGLIDITLTSSSRDLLIQREYTREFWGEGQLFFYLKRKNITSITNGASATNATISMTASKYVLRLPNSETNYQ